MEADPDVLHGEAEEMSRQFFEATDGSSSMTFSQCQTHPEIATWLSEGSISQQQLRQTWDAHTQGRKAELEFDTFVGVLDDLETGMAANAKSGADFFASVHGGAEEKEFELVNPGTKKGGIKKTPTVSLRLPAGASNGPAAGPQGNQVRDDASSWFDGGSEYTEDFRKELEKLQIATIYSLVEEVTIENASKLNLLFLTNNQAGSFDFTDIDKVRM